MKSNLKDIFKQLCIFGFLLVCGISLYAQNPASAVRLSAGGRVTNAVIFQNSGYTSVSQECLTSYSALDSMVSGVGNIELTSTPFAQNFRISVNSPAYNSGTTDVLRDSDTIDLDNNPRRSCDGVDMGAFELLLPKTAITQQPQDIRTLSDMYPTYTLTLAATGQNLRYQWQHNNENLNGQTLEQLNLTGQWQDTGTYRVIVSGDCSSDTSQTVRVVYDDVQLDYGGFCPFEESWASVWTSGEIYTFLWDDSTTASEIRGLKAGTHRVEITDTSHRTKKLFFTPEKHISIDKNLFSVSFPDNANCNNGAIQLHPSLIDHIEDSLIYTFLWTIDGDYYSDERDLNNVPANSSAYRLEMTKQSTGCTDTFEFTLPCYHQFSPSTTFLSPNGDGQNDYLDIKNIEHYPINKVTILNTYGEVIYSVDNYDNNKVVWQGKNKHGKLVPDGVYNYLVEVSGTNVLSGWLVMKIAK